MDENRHIVGIVSEADLIRRKELNGLIDVLAGTNGRIASIVVPRSCPALPNASAPRFFPSCSTRRRWSAGSEHHVSDEQDPNDHSSEEQYPVFLHRNLPQFRTRALIDEVNSATTTSSSQ